MLVDRGHLSTLMDADCAIKPVWGRLRRDDKLIIDQKKQEGDMASLTERMIRAARLDPEIYEEVEEDSNAMGQAMAVVVMSSVAAGIGGSHFNLTALFFGVLAALAGWYIWAFLTFLIGTRLLPEPQTRADMGQMLRTIGFASSPGLIRIFAFLPVLGGFVSVIAWFWMLAAMVVAVRQALDYRGLGRALGVCLIGWLVQVALAIAVVAVFGAPLT